MAAPVTRPLSDLDDPVARARREAARLLGALGDLDSSRHYGLRVATAGHAERAQAILSGLQMDLDAIARVLAPEAAPAASATLEVNGTCPDCGHGSNLHDGLAYRAMADRDLAHRLGCIASLEAVGVPACGCTRVRPELPYTTETVPGPADVPPGLAMADMAAIDPAPPESELRVLDGNR